MNEVIISVILPFRNAEDTLNRAIESILAQSFRDFELILINDGSDDQSEMLVSQFDDSRLKVVNLPTEGIVFALNHGISISRGRYLARMDADDYAYPNRLMLQYNFLEKNPDIGVVSGQVNFIGNRKKNLGYAVYVDWINSLTKHEDIYLNRFVESPIAHPSVMLRKNIFDTNDMYKVGGFPEDYELWLRLLENGILFGKVDEVILDWHDSENRLSRIHPNYDMDQFFKIKTNYFYRWFQKQFKNNPMPVLIWGIGKAVLDKSKYLEEYKLDIAGYVDVVKRPDKKVNGKPIFHYKEIPDNTFILSYVSDRTGRIKIHDYLVENGFVEGKDFYMMG